MLSGRAEGWRGGVSTGGLGGTGSGLMNSTSIGVFGGAMGKSILALMRTASAAT